MDRNHDGVVTIDEFLECCRCDQAIKNSMLVFDSSFWPCENGVNGNSHFQSSSHDQLTSHSIPNAKILYEDVNRNSNSHQVHQQHKHNTTSTATFVGNKMRNNVGHKASQMRRIQLSTASKRCKSMDNNTRHDKSATSTTNDSSDVDKSCQINVGEEMTSANNSTAQSLESPTLVRVKTWYTESAYGVLPLPTSLNLQHSHLPWYYFRNDVDLWPIMSVMMSHFYVSCSKFHLMP